VLEDLLREGRIDCSSRWVSGAIASGDWPEFDDAFILQKIRQLHRDARDSVCKARTKAILERRPPKLVAEAEFVSQRSDMRRFRHEKQLLKTKKPDWADEFKIDEDLWYIWDSGGMALTKVGSHVPISAVMEPGMEDKDRYEQAIRVLNEATNDSAPIVEISRSLMNVLASYALYSLRVYVLFPGDADDTESCREEISRRIKEDLSDFEWT
jgi:hypothetical protein